MDLSQATWRKSTMSQNQGACVEVATNLVSVVAVRDSKAPKDAALVIPTAEWTRFLATKQADSLRS